MISLRTYGLGFIRVYRYCVPATLYKRLCTPAVCLYRGFMVYNTHVTNASRPSLYYQTRQLPIGEDQDCFIICRVRMSTIRITHFSYIQFLIILESHGGKHANLENLVNIWLTTVITEFSKNHFIIFASTNMSSFYGSASTRKCESSFFFMSSSLSKT